VQDDEPSDEANVSDWQIRQVEDAFAPSAVEYVPLLHFVHEVPAFIKPKVPASH
jgi:hypothetical protein